MRSPLPVLIARVMRWQYPFKGLLSYLLEESPKNKEYTERPLLVPLAISCNMGAKLAVSGQFCCSATTGEMKRYTVSTEINGAVCVMQDRTGPPEQ